MFKWLGGAQLGRLPLNQKQPFQMHHVYDMYAVNVLTIVVRGKTIANRAPRRRLVSAEAARARFIGPFHLGGCISQSSSAPFWKSNGRLVSEIYRQQRPVMNKKRCTTHLKRRKKSMVNELARDFAKTVSHRRIRRDGAS